MYRMYLSTSESPSEAGAYHCTVRDVYVFVTSVGAGRPLGTVMGWIWALTLGLESPPKTLKATTV